MKILIIFLLLTLNAFSQLQVIKDPISCTYGLRDQYKKWVVEPKYQEITEMPSGYFKYKHLEKWGILNRSGNILIPAKFDQIDLFYQTRFLVKNNVKSNEFSYQKIGILDTLNHWVLNLEYSKIQPIGNQRLLLEKIKSVNQQLKYQSSISNFNGDLEFPFVDGVILMYQNRTNIYMVGDQFAATYTVSGNVRFINHLGQPISDSTFDKGAICGDNYTVVKNQKYGLFDGHGKPIVYPKYRFEHNSYSYDPSLPCLHTHHQFITVDEQNRRGILNGDWQEIIPPTYQKLETINQQAIPFTHAKYLGYREATKTYDLIDQNGKVLFQANFLKTRVFQIPKTNYYDQQKYQVYFLFGVEFLGKTNWGLLNENGQIIVPAAYENIVLTQDQEILLVQKRPEKTPKVEKLISRNAAEFKTIEMVFKTKMDDIYLYQEDTKYITLRYDATENNWQHEIYGYNAPMEYGNFVLINGNLGAFVYHKKTNQFDPVKYMDFQQNGRVILQFTDGLNMLHPTKGLLFKKKSLQINSQFYSENRIWCQSEKGYWQLFDTLGKLKIDVEFEHIAMEGQTMIVQQAKLKGCIKSNGDWVIKPQFAELFSLTNEILVGITRNRKVGVIHLSHPSKIDTTYDIFFPLFISPTQQEIGYVLEKNGRSFCFDQSGNLLPISLKKQIINYWTNANYYNPFYIVTDEKYKPYLTKYQDHIFDFFYPDFRSELQKNRFSVLNGIKNPYVHSTKHFHLFFASENTISLSVQEDQNSYTDDFNLPFKTNAPTTNIKNWIIQENGIFKEVHFHEIFNTNSQTYQQLIIDLIQDQPHLQIDCNNTTFLFEEDKPFIFQENGIKIIFNNGQNTPFELLVSTNELKKLSSTSWILPYLE